jgi:RND family efflux transporter MFP subunit
VRSPIDGVVSVRWVGRGDVVALGAQLFTIIDPRTLRLEGAVPSDAFAGIRPGTPVTFRVRGLGDQIFAGEVVVVSPVADEVTRQIPVTVSLPNTDARLIAGLFAEGRVAVKSRRGLAVPSAAVDLVAPTPTVSRIAGGKVERVAVTLGVRDEGEDWIEITGGLAKGDQVLLGEARELEPGSPVEITTERREQRRAEGPSPTRGG